MDELKGVDNSRFKSQIKELVGNGISFPAKTINILRGCVVYLYLKNKEAIYIGMSKRGMLRALDERHKGIEGYDEFVIYQAKTPEDAVKAEVIMIKALKPKLNIMHNGKAKWKRREKWFRLEPKVLPF